MGEIDIIITRGEAFPVLPPDLNEWSDEQLQRALFDHAGVRAIIGVSSWTREKVLALLIPCFLVKALPLGEVDTRSEMDDEGDSDTNDDDYIE